MRGRFFIFQVIALLSLYSAQTLSQNIVADWYPTRVGDSWTYEREELDGANGGGMENPEIGRWRIEDTIESATRIPEGILIRKHSRALDPLPEVAHRLPWISANWESYILIAGNCVYDAH